MPLFARLDQEHRLSYCTHPVQAFNVQYHLLLNPRAQNQDILEEPFKTTLKNCVFFKKKRERENTEALM